jgi:hypothetical protein
MKTLYVLIAIAFPAIANAEVISYTMGIDVNCPSGLSE